MPHPVFSPNGMSNFPSVPPNRSLFAVSSMAFTNSCCSWFPVMQFSGSSTFPFNLFDRMEQALVHMNWCLAVALQKANSSVVVPSAQCPHHQLIWSWELRILKRDRVVPIVWMIMDFELQRTKAVHIHPHIVGSWCNQLCGAILEGAQFTPLLNAEWVATTLDSSSHKGYTKHFTVWCTKQSSREMENNVPIA